MIRRVWLRKGMNTLMSGCPDKVTVCKIMLFGCLFADTVGLGKRIGRVCLLSLRGFVNILFICINKHVKDWFPTGDKSCSSAFKIKFRENGCEYELEFINEKIRVNNHYDISANTFTTTCPKKQLYLYIKAPQCIN